MNIKSLIAGMIVFSLVGVPMAFAEDQETTMKQRDPEKAHRADHNAQVTLGGAKTFVTGEIRNIDGDYYFIGDEESGGEVRLLVNKDTNMDCSAVSRTSTGSSQDVIAKRQSTEQQAPQATERQREQGQKKDETAMGSGFNIGNCNFKRGDRIKADVDDNGRVTLLKALGDKKSTESQTARQFGESSGTGELAIPGKQATQGQLDMTRSQGYPQKEYTILPIPTGEFKVSQEETLHNRPVRDLNGKLLGSLNSVIMDSNTGNIEYAVVELKDGKSLQPVPWSYFAIKGKQRDLVLNTKEYQLSPEMTSKDAKDQSPELSKIINDMQSAKAPAALRDDHSSTSGSVDKSRHADKDIKGTLVRGNIKKFDTGRGEMLVRDLFSGKDVRMHVDKQTKMATSNIRDESFKEGDRVEAYITPDGHAFSLSMLRGQSGMPDDPEAGG